MLRPMSEKNKSWRLFIQTVSGRAYPRIFGLIRERSWLFFDVMMPMLSVFAYVFVYRAIHAPEQYIGFVVIGGAMTAFWMNILWGMSSQLYWEKETANLGLYIMSPAPMMAILLGMAFGGLISTTLRAAIVILIGSLVFGVHYVISSFISLVFVFFLSMVALYGMGMMMASLFLLFGREAWHLSNLAQEPIYLASGFYFPIKNLSFWIAAGASIIPLTLGLDAMRQLVFSGGATLGFLSVPLEAGILFVLCIVFLVAAQFLLAHIERLAIREGRITESRR
jgi:ABC-2 type transport system permease protein